MGCHDHCRFAQLCRSGAESPQEETCPEYLHWEDMAWDAECARADYISKDELPFSEELDGAEEVSDFAESE